MSKHQCCHVIDDPKRFINIIVWVVIIGVHLTSIYFFYSFGFWFISIIILMCVVNAGAKTNLNMFKTLMTCIKCGNKGRIETYLWPLMVWELGNQFDIKMSWCASKPLINLKMMVCMYLNIDWKLRDLTTNVLFIFTLSITESMP